MIRCTTCRAPLRPFSGEYKMHPQMNVFTCRDCYFRYNDEIISLDKHGKNAQCNWCGRNSWPQGPDSLLKCTKQICPNAFCTWCINNNISSTNAKKYDERSKFLCFVCDNFAVKAMQVLHTNIHLSVQIILNNDDPDTIVSAEIQSNNSAKSQTKPSVNESIKNAFNDEETSDMKLLVDDKIIYVHRSMLKIRSKSFIKKLDEYQQLQSSPKRNNKKKVEVKEEVDTPSISIMEYSYDVIYAFVYWLYTDEVRLQDGVSVTDVILDLLQLADEFKEEGLQSHCYRLIKKHISVKNVSIFYAASIKHDAKELKQFCFDYIVKHIASIVDIESFQNLEKELIIEFLRHIARNTAEKRSPERSSSAKRKKRT